jgi:hypothetical protein
MTGLMWFGTQNYQSIGRQYWFTAMIYRLIKVYAVQRPAMLVTRETASIVTAGQNTTRAWEAYKYSKTQKII